MDSYNWLVHSNSKFYFVGKNRGKLTEVQQTKTTGEKIRFHSWNVIQWCEGDEEEEEEEEEEKEDEEKDEEEEVDGI